MIRVRFPARGQLLAWVHAPGSLLMAAWAIAVTVGVYEVGVGRISPLWFVMSAGGSLALLLLLQRWLEDEFGL